MRNAFISAGIAAIAILSSVPLLGQQSGSSEPGLTCPVDKWCQTWPVAGLPATPPAIRGWNRLLFDTKLGRAAAYLGNSAGTVTFSTDWWSYAAVKQTATSKPAWQHESSCGDRGAPRSTITYWPQGLLAKPIPDAQATTFSIEANRCDRAHRCTDAPNRNCRICIWNPVTNFDAAVHEVPTLWIDDEEVQYCDIDQDPESAKFGVVTVGEMVAGKCTSDPKKRGIRGTAAASHESGVSVFPGCPNPQGAGGLHAGNPVAVTDHMQSRHPWRQTAYDNKRGWWWQVSGKPENNVYRDTWHYDPSTGQYVEVVGSNAPDRTDGALEYDSDHDVLIEYGGSSRGSDTDTTWIMCLNNDADAKTLSSYGCGGKSQMLVWNLVSTRCAGKRWDGSACNSEGKAKHSGPGFRRTQSLTYDSGDHKFILFGGTSDGPPSTCEGPDNQTPPYTWSRNNCASEPNDVWMYDVPTRTWTQLTNTGDVPAPSRRPAIAYNSNLNYFVLWAGPVPQGGAAVGKFEQGLYTLTIDVPNARAIWKLTSVGANGDPQPTLQYSQMSPNCQTVDDPRYDQCDHASENLVYDPANHVFIYTDLDHLVGTSVIQTWQLPEAGLKPGKGPGH